MSDTSPKIAKRESIKRLCATPQNTVSQQGQTEHCPCIGIRHVKKLWIANPLHVYTTFKHYIQTPAITETRHTDNFLLSSSVSGLSEAWKRGLSWTYIMRIVLCCLIKISPLSNSLCVSILQPLHLSPWYNRTGWQGVKHQVTYLHLHTFQTLRTLVSAAGNSTNNKI